MSLATQGAERAKFGYLLQLAQEQITALECDDMYGFDRILAAKRAVIASLTDGKAMLAADPSLATVVARIQECDKSAQRLLYRKVGRIMRAQAELQQYRKARRAYVKPGRRAAPPALQFLPDTPQFFDQTS